MRFRVVIVAAGCGTVHLAVPEAIEHSEQRFAGIRNGPATMAKALEDLGRDAAASVIERAEGKLAPKDGAKLPLVKAFNELVLKHEVSDPQSGDFDAFWDSCPPDEISVEGSRLEIDGRRPAGLDFFLFAYGRGHVLSP